MVRTYAILNALGRGLCAIGVSVGGGVYTLCLYQSPSSLLMVSSFPSVVIKDAESATSVNFYVHFSKFRELIVKFLGKM